MELHEQALSKLFELQARSLNFMQVFIKLIAFRKIFKRSFGNFKEPRGTFRNIFESSGTFYKVIFNLSDGQTNLHYDLKTCVLAAKNVDVLHNIRNVWIIFWSSFKI